MIAVSEPCERVKTFTSTILGGRIPVNIAK
jgi:hypothetical protein